MPFLAGLGLGLSLIVAIGAQNVFVLRQGLRKEHVGWVVAICAISDAALIVLGVSGMGAAIVSLPWLATGARWAGAAFLLGYAILAGRRAWQKVPEAFHVDDGESSTGDSGHVRSTGGVATRTSATATTLRTAILTCLALTWLNPHVYLDTVFLLGTVAASHGDAKWIFAAGAVMGSVLWFISLGYGARLLNRWLTSPQAWRVLDGIIAVVMTVLAVMLALSA